MNKNLLLFISFVSAKPKVAVRSNVGVVRSAAAGNSGVIGYLAPLGVVLGAVGTGLSAFALYKVNKKEAQAVIQANNHAVQSFILDYINKPENIIVGDKIFKTGVDGKEEGEELTAEEIKNFDFGKIYSYVYDFVGVPQNNVKYNFNVIDLRTFLASNEAGELSANIKKFYARGMEIGAEANVYLRTKVS